MHCEGEKVYDIAGDSNNQATVDLDNCQRQGSGFAQLCTRWRDPDFDASIAAVYYLRAVENPSCRYSAYQCASLDASSLTLSKNSRPSDCQSPQAKKAIQERAWSSPIWYTP